MTVTRVTLFKIPSEEHRNQLLGMYRTMKQDALKVGFAMRNRLNGNSFETTKALPRWLSILVAIWKQQVTHTKHIGRKTIYPFLESRFNFRRPASPRLYPRHRVRICVCWRHGTLRLPLPGAREAKEGRDALDGRNADDLLWVGHGLIKPSMDEGRRSDGICQLRLSGGRIMIYFYHRIKVTMKPPPHNRSISP